MAKACLRVTVIFSLSLSAAYALSPPKATASDLLAVLGPTRAKVNPVVARQLDSCFRFLVPFEPSSRRCSVENELVWWPPQSVLDLARIAVDSGGDPAAIHRALDPTPIPIPDCEGCREDKCQLTRSPYGWHFVTQELNTYLSFLFQLIVRRGPDVGLDVCLSRYDLFHGHLFVAKDTGRLGILFHAKEYPAFDKQVFPYNMGYCQRGSNVTYDDSMNLRNILWLAPLPSEEWEAPGVLVVLDARPGGIIYGDIIPEYVHVARTIYEADLGHVVLDVNYLNVGDQLQDYQLYIC